ncbi:MAG: histidinol-phosphatase [Solobacterium sp.]|nr:histidinol-phosphatase [Solobacterium sp.]
MIKTNWHTHTARCGHAVGTDEEYVQAAIQGGIRTLGFSDHAAYLAPFPSERMDYEQVEEYKASVLSLKEKYKDQIDIYLGMEVEYYPTEWEQLSEYRRTLDYCILGQHNLELDGRSTYAIMGKDTLYEYCELLAGACEHALCDYIAHPDVALWSYPYMDSSVTQAAERIADISLHYNMPLELNTGSGVHSGKRRYPDGERYAYPTRQFFEVFARRQCPIIIGLDVHDPKLFLSDTDLNRARSVIEGLDCRILYDFDLVSAAKERKKLFY